MPNNRALMEKVLVRYGSLPAEHLREQDDHTLRLLVQHLKVRMVIPDSATDLKPVSLADVLLATG